MYISPFRSVRAAGRRMLVIGAHMTAPSRQGFVLLSATASAWQAFDASAVLVSEPLAYHLGLSPGASLELPTPQGPLAVEVAAIFRDQVRLTPLRYWQAGEGTRYPLDWRLQVKEFQLDLEVTALLDDQLMDHSVHYWEGAVDVIGSHRGQGYLELSGYAGGP